MADNIIDVANLCHRFVNGRTGLMDVNLKVRAGEFVVLAGPNGSGKTTFLRHLNGLLAATSGRVVVDGIDAAKKSALARQLVGMVFQDADSQIVGETVFDDIAFGPENLCLESAVVKQRVHEAASAVGLEECTDQRPHILSGGEKRRLAIAGVLAMEPKVLVFDEPFSNLDYPGVKCVLKQIVDLHAGGKTVILATHDIEKVFAHAQRLVVMHGGTIVSDGTPGQVVNRLENYGVRAPCASKLGVEVSSWLN